MINHMNKASIVELIAKKTGHSKKVVTEIINENYDLISEALASGENRVSVSGFGSFNASIVPAKKMVSPLNGGQTIQVDKTSKVRFTPSDKLKSKITNANKAAVRKSPKNS